MRLKFLYLWRNLTRNPLRSLLTCAAVALPIMILVLAVAVIDGIERYLDNSSRQLRLVVFHKASVVNPLPAGHRSKIESLDPRKTRLVSVCGVQWLGGKIENDPRLLSTLACDPDTFVTTFPEYLRRPEELAAWLRDRQALVVGRGTAVQFGWKTGDRVTIRPSVPPYAPMQFHVVSTAEEATDTVTNFCRNDYLMEELKNLGFYEGQVSFFFVKCATRPDLDRFRADIDALFANSLDETLTLDEKTFVNQFVAQQFDLPRNLTILAAVTVFVAVMAAMNTMSMNFRDRLNEYATLKSLGFGSRTVFAMVQSESLLLCALGGLIGAMGPYIAFTHTPLREFTVPIIQHLEIHPWVCTQAVGVSLLVGLMAAIWPSWAAARMKVVNALRALE